MRIGQSNVCLPRGTLPREHWHPHISFLEVTALVTWRRRCLSGRCAHKLLVFTSQVINTSERDSESLNVLLLLFLPLTSFSLHHRSYPSVIITVVLGK